MISSLIWHHIYNANVLFPGRLMQKSIPSDQTRLPVILLCESI
jgi:hypothetical protein